MSLVPPLDQRTALSALGHLYDGAVLGGPVGQRPSGFPELDQALGGGLRDGELALLAGKPGVGKSVLCLQWARNLVRQGGRVVHVCYDHSPGELVARLLHMELRERSLAMGTVDDDELIELTARLRDVASGALHVSEAVDSHSLLGEAERAVALYGDRLVFLGGRQRDDLDEVVAALPDDRPAPVTVFVDYLEKMPAAPSIPADERVEGAVSELKALAVDHHLAVVAAATVETTGFTTGNLELQHVGRARTLTYEADLVLGMNDCDDHVCVRVVKHRSGAAGASIRLEKDFNHYRMSSSPIPELA